jgi:Fe(3+) dicitrate transport protein
VDRYSATIGHTQDFGDGWFLDAKAWMSYMDLSSRGTVTVVPSITSLQQEIFQNEGADVRVRKRWGRGNAFTAGFVAYHSNGPFRRWNDTDLQADQFDHSGTPTLDENRSTDYAAIFAENVFRFGSFHIVPSARLDYERVKVDELVKPATAHYFIDTDINRTIPLFALGFGNDFGRNNETYFNVSQGWRPVRYFDVASSFGNTLPGNGPDPAKSLSWEAGVHGTPLPGLFYDIGVFWIDFTNRIETQRGLGPTGQDSIAINSGDTRHRGVEGELSYDFLAGHSTDEHLTAFANFTFLDAVFTDSKTVPANIGNSPAYSPHTVIKGGLSWRKVHAYSFSATGQYVSSQYFQDSNLPSPLVGPVNVPAKIPGFTVFDVAADYYITRNVRLLGGVSNVFDKKYYSRVFSNGIEPSPGRRLYAGIALGF